LAIVILLVVGLWAYTQNWPPIYVVESSSMQHGSDDHLGLINTGDLVLAQKIDPSSITTYVVGLQTGYATYGEYGDVMLYHPNGDTGVTPIIHRAIIYLVHNSDGTWSYPSLNGLACSSTSHPYYRISTTPDGCGTSRVTGTLTLYGIGWQNASVPIPLATLGDSSGFVTMGDNNYLPGSPARGEIDQSVDISTLVQESWIVGVARGMVPWFGAVKLLLEGQASMVPTQSWQLMALTLAGVLLAALGVHLALRRSEREEEEGNESTPLTQRVRGWFHRGSDEEDDSDSDAKPTPARRPRSTSRTRSNDELLRRARRPSGRPRPTVRRGGSRKGDGDKDDGSL
jgi:signal peptidase